MKCDIVGLLTNAGQDCKSGYYQGALDGLVDHIKDVRSGKITIGQFAAHYHLDYEPGGATRSPSKIAEEKLRSTLISACGDMLAEKLEGGKTRFQVIDARPEVPTQRFADALKEMAKESIETRFELKKLKGEKP